MRRHDDRLLRATRLAHKRQWPKQLVRLPENPPPNLSTKAVFQEFINNTTLMGVQHTFRKRSIIWLVSYMACVVMSVVQSWKVTMDYFDQKTNQRFLIGNKRYLPFPSVTICSNVVLPGNFNDSFIPDYDNSVDDSSSNKCKSEDDMERWEAIFQSNQEVTLRYLRNLTTEDRVSLGQPLKNLVTSCSLGDAKCDFSDKNMVRVFNNPFYGNCFTVNPAFNLSHKREIDTHDKLNIIMKLSVSGRRLIGGKPRVGVLIHPPGSAPILDSASVQEVYGGQLVDISLKLTEKSFLKKYTDSVPSCIDDVDFSYRLRSRYYSEETPYLYSVEACMKSCEQHYMAEYCNLLDGTLPIQSPEEEKYMNVSVPPIGCDAHFELDMDVCNCRIPCRIVQYAISADTSDILLPECEQQKLKQTSKKRKEQEEAKMRKVKVVVYFLSNIYEKIEEEVAYTWSEFLGILGGNMSLWIGLCVVSLLELVELVINLLKLWRRRQLLKRSQKDGRPPQPLQRPINRSIAKWGISHPSYTERSPIITVK